MNQQPQRQPRSHPQVPPEPDPGHRASRSRTSRPSWPWIVGAGILVTAVAAVGIVQLAASDHPVRLAAGSRVGHADPFDTRHRADIQPVWSHDLLNDPSEMVVEGADVFVVGPYAVTALATDTGEERWVADVKDAEPYLAVSDDSVAVGAVDGFELLDRVDGASRWRAAISEPTDRARGVAIVGDGPDGVVVGATDHGGLTGFSLATGAVRWTTPAGAPPHGRLVADAATGAVIALTGTDTEARLQVIDARTGAVRWATTLGPDTGVPMVVGSTLLVVTGDGDAGELRAFSLADGRPRWSRPLLSGAGATMGLVHVGDAVVGLDSYGTAFSVVIETGVARWRTELPSPALADSPAVVDGLMIVHDTFAKIHTLDVRTGRLLGSRQSVGVPIGLGAGAHRVVYAQGQVQYGQVIAYAPAMLRRPVGAR